MLFFHEEPEPRNYVVTRCASGPRIREGLHGESVCEPTLLRFIPSPSLITTKAYLYTYIYSVYTRGTRRIGRPSTLLFIQLDRGKSGEGEKETSDARTSYVDNRNFTLDRTRATRRVSL